ncbi:AzlD domain-containing protein [Nocardioides sp.]|uniref:AzlD domain-containing protein n=1 Tax=Nocardioides sp. TaxID=35761 RepID=UPI0035199186
MPDTLWWAILAAGAGCYLLKYAGLAVPARVLADPRVARAADVVPVGLLAALVAVQTLATGDGTLQPDARLAGLGIAVLLLLLRAPFLVVVVGAAVVTALTRLL